MIVNITAEFYEEQVPPGYSYRNDTSFKTDIEDFLRDTLKVKVDVVTCWNTEQWTFYYKLGIKDRAKATIFMLKYGEYII